MLFGILDQLRARLNIPLAPGSDDFDRWIERIGRQFEAHLIVSLTGGAMGDGIGANLSRYVDEMFGDQRPRNRGTNQILTLIERIGPKHRKDEITNEFLTNVDDADSGRGWR